MGIFIEWSFIELEFLVFYVDGSVLSIGESVTGNSGGHYTIKLVAIVLFMVVEDIVG